MNSKRLRTPAVSLLFLLSTLFFLSRGAIAGTGMPMMEGLKNPTELATLVDYALQRDPTGKTVLSTVRCKKSGSCATAYDYFYGIRLAHPSAKLGDIADLPRYLRSLERQPAPGGVWQMSRLLVHGAQHTYDARGWHRAFFKGESVWVDPNTGEDILAGNCGNVIGAKIGGKNQKKKMVACPRIRVTVKPGNTALQFILLGGIPKMGAACPFGYKPPASNILYALPTECPHRPCDFSETIASSGGMVAGPSGGINVSRSPGVYIFQVSREFARDKSRVAAFCVTTSSGAHSCAKDIRPSDYHNELAVVGYTDLDRPKGWTGNIRIWCFPTFGPCGKCR